MTRKPTASTPLMTARTLPNVLMRWGLSGCKREVERYFLIVTHTSSVAKEKRSAGKAFPGAGQARSPADRAGGNSRSQAGAHSYGPAGFARWRTLKGPGGGRFGPGAKPARLYGACLFC